MRILALDVSKTCTGWAFGVAGGATPICGIVRFGKKPRGDKSKMVPDDVWYEAFRWVADMINVHAPDAVYIEAPLQRIAENEEGQALTTAETLGMLWSLQAVMRVAIRGKLNKNAVLVHASTARKNFTGRGTYPKGEVKDAIRSHCIRLGWLTAENASYDRADALCVFGHAVITYDQNLASQIRIPPGVSFERPDTSARMAF